MVRGPFLQGEVADRVLTHVRDGTSVNLMGMRCSGRSAVLEHVAGQLESEGVRPVRVTGVGALQDRPLAALAISGVPVAAAPLGPAVLAGAVRALEDAVTARPSVLVIDDADDLDAATTGAVLAVRGRVPVPVVAVSRFPGGHRAVRRPLAEELHPAARVVIPPLDYGSVLRLVHGLLPGPVERSTVARLATASGGLPGLVTDLVDVGRIGGHLVREADGWTWRGDLWDPALVQAVDPLLAHLDRTALNALTTVALSGMMELRRAAQLVSWDDLAVLEGAGLVQVAVIDREPVVAVFPPLLARFLAQERSVVRSLQVQQRTLSLHARLQTAPARSRGDAVWPPGDLALPLLDRRFVEHWQAELADRRPAWAAEPVPSTAVPLIAALQAVGAPAGEIDLVVRGTCSRPDEARATALMRVAHALDVGLRRRDPRRAVAYLDSHELPVGFSGLDRAVRAHLTLVTQRVPDVAELQPSPPDGPVAREALRVVRISSAVAGGRLGAAVGEMDGFVPSVELLRLGLELSGALTDLVGGDVRAGTQRALTQLDAAQERLDAGAVRAHAYVTALGLLVSGRLRDAAALLSQVLALSSSDGLAVHYQDGDLVLAAVVASFQGDTHRASALAAQAHALTAPRGPLPWMWPDAAPVLVGPRNPAAAARLWELSEERAEAGLAVAAVVAGVEAMERHPHPERGHRLLRRCAGHESPVLRVLSEYVGALGARDADALAAAAASLRAGGLGLYATRASVARAVALHAQGELDACADEAQQAWAEAESRGGPARGLFTPVADAVGLTPRERDVAHRIGQGLPSSAVAAALGLSVRTVDNHIQNGLRKVGVTSRRALVAASSTWAAPAGADR
jgi:DNA-binding CsgD family transcriptional regulator